MKKDNLQIARPKILVVDDTAANIMAMKVVLKKVPADLVTATTGNTALAEALKHDFSVILLDVNMPGMDGFEVAEILSSAEETKHIPIIFVTAVDYDEPSLLKGYESGGVDFIQKPILATILISKINVFLDLWLLKAGLENEIALRRSAELEVEYLAQHDALTHLPNRRQIHHELQLIIDHAQRKKQQFAVLFLDLDGFKKINDEMGHEVGDVLLVEMANRFKATVRSTDLVGRLGGDEFILAFPDLTDPLLLKNKLQQLIAEAARPFDYQGRTVQISGSIGVALYPDHGTSVDELIDHADSALYLAKGDGKNNFQFFSEKLNQQMERNIQVEHHLREAINANEFEVYYQPIIELPSEKVVGAEALLRWNSASLGFVPPDEFIPIAETAGLINEIGLWVLNQVVDLMFVYKNLHFAVNASTIQFKDNQLSNAVEYYIQKGIINPSKLEIEITEGVLMDHSDRTEEQLRRINALGVSLSVDDFGTGYSSLSYLKNCPVNTVKIDRSFVSDIPKDKDDMTIVKTIIAMAKGLDLRVIAEGVETREQADFIKQEDCDFAQGYFFSKPLPKKVFEEYLVNQLITN